MAFKKFRKMKVYNVSGYNYKDTPTIILKGDWLKETGFGIGSLIQVEFENGKLIITPREAEEVEYHAPCGKCMMVAEDCKGNGKIAEGTVLIRKTVAAILQGISSIKFTMFKNKSEEFITKCRN